MAARLRHCKCRGTVNDASLSHKCDKLPLDDHRSHNNDSQNNDGANLHSDVRSGLTLSVSGGSQPPLMHGLKVS